ncbi:MAG: elongation factor Ts [Candidatus Omnitrophica bacterium]|nr:elongation factor Ts [Candidatus Omnitrophota bacterium]
MSVSVDAVKELRAMTFSSIAHCREALQENNGDIKKAAAWLRKRGLEIAAKKQGRAAKEGRIEAYVHFGNKIGVLLEVNCESDFVARNEDFVQFTKDLAMQIAASSPEYVRKEDIPEERLTQEGKKEEFIKAHCLLEQAFIKDSSISIEDYLGDIVAKLGENIVVRRFVRYKIGE